MVDKYFKLVSNSDLIIHIKLSGFWSKSVVRDIFPEYMEILCGAVDSYEGAKFIVLADLSDMGNLTEEAREAIGRGMNYCIESGMYKAVEIMPKSIVKMGIAQAANKVKGGGDFRSVVSSEKEGLEKVEQLRKEILQAS